MIEREVRLEREEGQPPTMVLTEGGTTDRFQVDRVGNESDTKYRLRPEAEKRHYVVSLSARRNSCTCNRYFTMGRCRHIDAVTELRKQGQL